MVASPMRRPSLRREILVSLSQRNEHGRSPALAIIRVLMARRQGPSVVSEYALAAVVYCLPHPRTISESQCLRNHVPIVVKEVGAELIGGWIVNDDFEH